MNFSNNIQKLQSFFPSVTSRVRIQAAINRLQFGYKISTVYHQPQSSGLVFASSFFTFYFFPFLQSLLMKFLHITEHEWRHRLLLPFLMKTGLCGLPLCLKIVFIHKILLWAKKKKWHQTETIKNYSIYFMKELVYYANLSTVTDI